MYEATVHVDKNSTIHVLKKIFNRRGFLRVVHSDRGSHFHNHEVDEFARENGINWVFGGPGTAKTQEKLDEIRHLATERQLETWKNRVALVITEKAIITMLETWCYTRITPKAGNQETHGVINGGDRQ